MFKKTKKLNQNPNKTKGITLVALIITIIVLIILAGVTISIALGENGIFRKSKKAVDEYQKSAKAEEEELDTFYDNLESLDPNSLAAHVKLGDYVEYNPREGVEDKELSVTIPTGSYDGDTSSEKYQNWGSIDIDGNPTASGTPGSGYDGNAQTFTVPQSSEELNKIKWRVLSIEDGCVNLISEKEIGRKGLWSGDLDNDTLYLNDITGYAYGPQILDEICNLYGQGTGAKKARSITVEDVNKITGYNPMNDSDYQNTYGKEHTWSVDEKTYKWRNLFYFYNYNEANMNLKTSTQDSIPYQLIFKCDLYQSSSGPTNYAYYWLGSRFVGADDNCANFSMRDVYKGELSSNYLFYCNSSGDINVSHNSFPVRPVVTLKSTVKFDEENSGDGTTAEQPIKFTITEEE